MQAWSLYQPCPSSSRWVVPLPLCPHGASAAVRSTAGVQLSHACEVDCVATTAPMLLVLLFNRRTYVRGLWLHMLVQSTALTGLQLRVL
jgi:hypothetical protein